MSGWCRRGRWALFTVASLTTGACTKAAKPPPDTSKPVPVTPVTASSVNTRFVTMDNLLAAVEMQLSGEPLAETMGRDKASYSRDFLPPDTYFDPSPTSTGPWIDLAGFSTAIESYEYSKQAMNNLAFESGAGVSLAFGPILNPMGVTGSDALALLHDQVQHFGELSQVSSHLVSFNKPLLDGSPNTLGWPGLWPTMQPYRSFDPAIKPTGDTKWLCSITSDDDPGAGGAALNADYECDATTLHLPNRTSQIEAVITPGSTGWAGWKYALWTINYLQVMHDANETPIDSVSATDLANVGQPGNTIAGHSGQPGTAAVPGVFIGSSNIEGFQAALMITELDNAAQQWLTSLTTTDGTTLSGFATLKDALQYDYSAPLRWIPSAIAVAEVDDASGFPRPAQYSVQTADSSLLDLAGLLGAYAELYSLTDHANADVGGTQPAQVYFDGDPFPADNPLADGEPTLHDRALGLMRFIIVSLDRLHRDPSTSALTDRVTFAQGTPTRSATVDAASTAYALVALRVARLSLNSHLSLYANVTPDAIGEHTLLDDVPFTGAPNGATFSQRLNALLAAESSLLLSQLTTSDGHAYAGWDFSKNAPTSTDETLDAYTAAVRGLLTAYLSTGDTRYRERAITVFNRMETVFYDPSARLYSSAPVPQDEVTYTPKRFGLLQGALRDMYELVGALPGKAELGKHLEERIARLNKLVLNGWDDRNGDNKVDWPDECINVVNGLPRGGLQMAERALSGEVGSMDDRLSMAAHRVSTSDREHDCVPEIDDAQLPAALASELKLKLVRP